MKLEGMKEVLAEIRRVGKEGPAGVREGVKPEMQGVLEDAQTRAPRKTGKLASTGRIRKTKRGYDVTFGNKDVPYANYQHEHVGLTHESGQAKYLEQPMGEHAERLVGAGQAGLNQVIEGA